MRMLEEFFPEFTKKLDEIDALYKEKMPIDEKTAFPFQMETVGA